jgi:hypothetical protein
MNLRTTLTGAGAAALLVLGPGFALANSAGIDGSLNGGGSAVVDGADAAGEGAGQGEVSITGEFTRPSGPDAPEAPQAPQASAPQLPEAPEAPDAPDAPEAPEVAAPNAPEAPEAPQTPTAPEQSERSSTESGGEDTRVRADGRGAVSGSVGGDSEPQADHEVDGNGEAEHGGHKISVP